MHEPEFLLFASDATLVGLSGGLLLVIAAVATLADRRRTRRTRIEAVGWVPWTAVYLLAAFVGIILLTLALKGWIAG
ncbi:hypothetical protein GRI97_17810 [Altererythrobacter xixiisoli]|uniref:Uncharacterized protein n=1 Tax=Croceibacterium xixiisoli TaxID=1476466 RepID=A0A6I4U1T9_9SPHN|nr:hypothetical protein [Croceibacterium xixiisoli]MXP00848.1 hypothetical protein [Croceibacterium xixiisoli]